jgi:hypothetical protein
MAVLHLTPSSVGVEFTTTEKILGLLRDFTLRRDQVVEATFHVDSVAVVRGLRAPGLAVPGRRKIGTWRRSGYRAAVSVAAPTPAVRLRLRGHRYDELIISHPEAAAWAAALQPAQP